MPTVEGLQLGYALHVLPPGRLPFRRWRWELWHGTNLIGAGWRLTRAEAGRALRVAGLEFAHRLFGLAVPPRDPRFGIGDLLPGSVARVDLGITTCVLTPRALEHSSPSVAAGSLS